jgi:hypothetical protein
MLDSELVRATGAAIAGWLADYEQSAERILQNRFPEY